MARPPRNSLRFKYILPTRRFVMRVVGDALWAVSPRLTFRLIMRMFSVPRYPRPSEEQTDILRRGQRFQLTVLGRKLIGWRWGEGPLVILVHGWGERGIRFHRFVSPLVDDGFSVVTFDFPAHGESEGVRTNFIEFTVALKSVLENSGPPVAVIGYSMGGGAAVSMWEKFDSNTRLVLISPLFDIFITLSNLFEKIGFSPKLGDSIFKAVEDKYQVSLSSINPAENASKVRGKVLVMNDEEDWIVTMEHAEELTRTMPGARLFRTTGLGHTRMLESEQVMTEALAFIRNGQK